MVCCTLYVLAITIYYLLHPASSEGPLGPEQSQPVKEFVQKAKETCQAISTEHKDIHASISKFGKAIDKVYDLYGRI